MRKLVLLHLIIIGIISTRVSSTCNCINGGTCNPQGSHVKCQCPSSFIGQNCHLSATQVGSQLIHANLITNYSFFYFQPREDNYYKLIFNICMVKNPTKTHSLFYIQTEGIDGSLRQIPSQFETANILFQQHSCTTLSTHYISAKRKQNQSYRKIIIGLKLMQYNETRKYFSTHLSYKQMNKTITKQQIQNQNKIQEIIIKMNYQVYLRTSNYDSFILMFIAFVLLLILTYFICHLRKKQTINTINIDTLYQRTVNLHRVRSMHRAMRGNPEGRRQRLIDRFNQKNHQKTLEIFMPATHYRTNQQITEKQEQQFISNSRDGQTCSICLIDFEIGEQIRYTPCKHYYHKECIDNWYQNSMSCPMCRRKLNFNHQILQLYCQFLRSQLSL